MKSYNNITAAIALSRFITIIIVIAVLQTTEVVVVASAASNNNNNNNEKKKNDFLSVSLSDLPPLPQKVLQWSSTDVERWMNITVGYPELSSIIRKYLIDGPTLLNLNNVEEVFSSSGTKNVLHPAQIAKIRTHQRILRSQSPECGGSCAAGGGNGNNNLVSFWSYLSYSSLSTTFHLTAAVVGPRFAFISAYIFDRPLLCCAVATPTVEDVETEYAEKIMSSSSSGDDSSSSKQNNNNNNNNNDNDDSSALVVSPCGYSSSVCAATPSILTTIFTFLFPFASMIWYGILRAMCPHPFIAMGWFFACLCHQFAELFTWFRFFQMIRAKQATLLEILKEEVIYGYLHWLFWGPCLISLFVGYLLPHWCSYIILIALTGVAIWSSGSFVLEFLRAVAGPPQSGENQQQDQQDQQGESSNSYGRSNKNNNKKGGSSGAAHVD